MYGEALAMTPYHSSNGGYTETAAGAWGGSKDTYPYLTNVFTPYEDYRNVPNGKWENIVLPAELYKHVPESYRKTLTGKNYLFDMTRDFSGFNEKMTVKDELGNSLTLSTSGAVRGFFGDLVKSANFGIANTYIPSENVSSSMTVITAQGTQEITGINGYEYLTADGRYTCAGFKNVYVFDGQGYGHGVGLSQFGSRCMADAGFLYDEIILTYFPGTDIISIYDLFTETESEF
jgi:stage II sporulation protein D